MKKNLSLRKIMKSLRKLLKGKGLRALWIMALLVGGLSASSWSASLTAAWNADTTLSNGGPLTDLTQYTIYYATFSFQRGGAWLSPAQAKATANVGTLAVPATTSTQVTSQLVSSLLSGSGYFFRLTASNTGGGESGFNVDSSGLDTQASTFDVNKDGSINVLDVQASVNEALGVQACAMPDPNLTGTCDVTDVQQVVNKALGL